ncbi:MAG: hypothetical protein R6T98_01775 [Desulfatiglandales bacterium]
MSFEVETVYLVMDINETFEKPGDFHYRKKDLREGIETGNVTSWSATFKYFFGVPCRRSEAIAKATV